MVIYAEYEKFIIDNKDDLVELNIIKLIESTLKLLKKEVIYSDVERRFYLYDEGYWQPIATQQVISIYWSEYSRQVFPLFKNSKLKKVIELGKAIKDGNEKQEKILKEILKRFDFFIKLTQKKVKEYIESLSMACERIPDLNYDKIPLKNGYVNISDFTFHNKTPYIYNRYTLQFNYKKNETKTPVYFLKFLEQILPSEEDKEFLINWLAYMLVIGNHRQKSLFLFGSGRNGKGVLSKIIYQLLGAENCSTLTVSQLSGEKYYLGQLNNKLLNISPDSDEKDKIDIGAFKTITGNDNVTVRDIYGSPFNMIYQGKLLFSINKVPYFSNKDLAIMERIEILNFPVTIEEKNRIPNLENIILEREGDLIFNFLLQRLKELKKINFKFKAPASVKNFTNEIMDEQDNISNFMFDYINENEIENKWFIGLTMFYNRYKDYTLEGGFKILNRTNFKESVQRWASRRNEIKIQYRHDGKNYIFEFTKTVLVKNDIPIVYETIPKEAEALF
jgi:P4 family phage/plasmid primase-like protien